MLFVKRLAEILKLSLTQTDLSSEISQIFAVFSAISLNIDELKKLNTAKI